MTESVTFIRWKLRQRSPWARWHIKGHSLNNRLGKTGCGKKYRRSAAIEERDTPVDDDEMCANCAVALGSEPE